MGDPKWGVGYTNTDLQNVAVTTTVDSAGDVTTIMRSPRRGSPSGLHNVAVCTTGQPAVEGAGLANELKVLASLYTAGQLSPSEYEMCKATVIARYQGGDPMPKAQNDGVATMQPASMQGISQNDFEVSPEGSPSRDTTCTFTLLVCVEVYGNRINLELEFEGKPSMPELRAKAQMLFQQETDAMQGEHPPYDVVFSRMQVYNDQAGTWCDLIMRDQLHDFAQLYAFQVDNMWQTPGPAPSPQDIPAPRIPVARAPLSVAGASVTKRNRYRVSGKTSPVPLRDGPSDASPALLWVPDGVVVTELAPSDGVWHYVEAEGRTGYIDAKHLCQPFSDGASGAPPPPASLPMSHDLSQAQTLIAKSPVTSLPVGSVPAATSHAASLPVASLPVSNEVVPWVPGPITVSVSAHIYGTVATVTTVVDTSRSIEELACHLEECLVAEARKRCLADVSTIADHVWRSSVVAKLVQWHDPNVPGWVDLVSLRQLAEGSNLFVQLTTSKERPATGDRVMLAPGHAPELLSTGCLNHGETGVIVVPPTSQAREQAVLPITVRGPRGDTFVYFKDDLMIYADGQAGGSGVVYAGRLQQELDELTAQKAAAVAAEDFLQAKELKDRIEDLLEQQRQEEEQRAARAQPYAEKLEALQLLKEEAIANEDYAEAKVLKDQIDELRRIAAEQAAVAATEDLPLPDQLRRGMSHVNASAGLMQTAEALHAQDPESLYNVISEFQPSLSRAKVQKNWRKIIGIYLTHAEKAIAENPEMHGVPSNELVAFDEVAEHIKGVINFLDNPLSPRTLREVRHLQKL